MLSFMIILSSNNTEYTCTVGGSDGFMVSENITIQVAGSVLRNTYHEMSVLLLEGQIL